MRTPDTIVSEWYAGEVGGVALFALLASRAPLAEAEKWSALAQVEQHTADRLAEALRLRGVDLPDTSHVGRRAQERCEPLRGQSWGEQMQWLYRIADVALQKMRADAATLPPALSAAGELIVAHEEMLVEFAARETAALRAAPDTRDASVGSLRLVRDFLAQRTPPQQGKQS